MAGLVCRVYLVRVQEPGDLGYHPDKSSILAVMNSVRPGVPPICQMTNTHRPICISCGLGIISCQMADASHSTLVTFIHLLLMAVCGRPSMRSLSYLRVNDF